MSTRRLLTHLACACLFLIGCTQAPRVDTRAEADALRSMEAQWAAAVTARDIDKMVANYAPDIVFMYPNGRMGVGKQELHKAWESWLADTAVSRTNSCTTDTVEVSASGDLAYTRGTGRWSGNTPTGLVEHSERWVSIYKKFVHGHAPNAPRSTE